MISDAYNRQTEVVIKALIDKDQYSRAKAAEIWLKSKTRAVIQDEKALDHISGARCYDELKMEMSSDPYWLKGQFD